MILQLYVYKNVTFIKCTLMKRGQWNFNQEWNYYHHYIQKQLRVTNHRWFQRQLPKWLQKEGECSEAVLVFCVSANIAVFEI